MQEHPTEIRPILAEANIKRRWHRLQVRRLNRSLTFETASNAGYFGLAGLFTLAGHATPDLQSAFIGAVGVTAAVLYKRGKALHKIKELDESIPKYEQTERSEEFDHLGLTFRGDRPMNTDDKHTPFHLFPNPLLIPKSFLKAVCCTANDFAVRPAKTVFGNISGQFRPPAEPKRTRFYYGTDSSCSNTGAVLYSRLPHINNDAVAQFPASIPRLKTSVNFTKKSLWGGLYSDYAEHIVNAGGAIGAAEFCYSVGKIAYKTGISAEQVDLTTGTFAAASLLVTYVALDPLENFLEDACSISSKIKAKFALLSNKRDGLAELNSTVQAIRDELVHMSYIDVGKQVGSLETHLARIQNLLKHIDTNSLDPNLIELLRHRNISPHPEPAA